MPQSVVEPLRGSQRADLVGTVLSERYRILRKLGEGGMGTVYLGEHTTINKKLAIKILSPEYSHKQDLVDRFLQEARAASMIDQENVVEITDFGSAPGGSVFFVMEYLNGEDLAATIKREGPLPWSRVKAIVLQICNALTAAHASGIVHRDMKPENCFRIKRGSNEDFIKVLDFGIAKVTSDDGEGSARALTRTGMIFGTPEYMSPEQAKGERVDHRVDVYATGIILYELLTGRVPFTADTFMGILTKHMFEAPPAPSTLVPYANIPRDVETIILKALQKDREYRFQSMNEMAAAMEAVGTAGAVAVHVVPEDLVVPPSSGRLRYAGQTSEPAGYPTSYPGVSGGDHELEPRRTPVGAWIGLAIAGLVVVGVGTAFGLGVIEPAMIGLGGKPSTTVSDGVPEAEPVLTQRPQPPQGDAAIAVAGAGDLPTPAAPGPISVVVEAPGLVADVFDDRDHATRLGTTNTPIEIAFGETPVALYVTAEGYAPQVLELVPNADKAVKAELAKLTPEPAPSVDPDDRRKPNRNHGHRKDRPQPAATDPAPHHVDPKPPAHPVVKPHTKPVRPKTENSPDLKDPFSD